jgi:hypothetical protein
MLSLLQLLLIPQRILFVKLYFSCGIFGKLVMTIDSRENLDSLSCTRQQWLTFKLTDPPWRIAISVQLSHPPSTPGVNITTTWNTTPITCCCPLLLFYVTWMPPYLQMVPPLNSDKLV